MQQLVRELVGQHDELRGWRKPVQDLDPATCRGAERAAQLTDVLNGNAALRDRGAKSGRSLAGITGRFCDVGKRLTIGLGDVLSRDSAS